MDYTIVNIAADISLNVYNGNKSAVMGLLSLFFYNRLQRFKYLQYRKLGYAVTSLPISYSDMISVLKASVVQCWKVAYLMY